MHPAELCQRIGRALRVELRQIDSRSPLLALPPEVQDMVLLDRPGGSLTAEMRLISPLLRPNVELRATVTISSTGVVSRLTGTLFPVGETFDVVTEDDLAWQVR
jgi:hypothetical protein